MSSSICIYEKDVIIRVGSKKFKCDQKFQEGKDLCIFHDERYLSNGSNHKNNEVRELLIKRIDEYIAKKEPLECIGYYLPDIKIEQEFKQPVYFSYCKFQGTADFSRSTFSAEVNFRRASFSAEADFKHVKFQGAADFNHATFSNRAYFHRAFFSDEVNFHLVIFLGQANFHYAKFLSKADFHRASFSG